MKYLLLRYGFPFVLIGIIFVSCNEDIGILENNEGLSASLTMTFCVPGDEMQTRGLTDLDDDGTITEAEKNMDGSRMFSLAVFIVDSQNEIVAKKTTLSNGEVSFTQNNTQATVAFTNLNYGETYQLLAIANFGEGAHYQIANNVDATTLLNGTVSTSSSGYICPNGTPYPLTLKKEIVLQPGVNTISGELVRTFARIRITVRNQSSTNDLQIKNLSFPEQFTYHTANLFETGGNVLSQPLVSHTGAVNAFTGTPAAPLVIGKNEGEVKSATIFDAYLLESNGGKYEYTLNLKYEGATETVYTVANSYITNPNDMIDRGLYVIYNTNARKYLYDNGTATLASVSSYLSDGKLNHNCVWRFVKTSGNNYKIESMGRSGYFIKSSGIKNNTVPMTSVASNTDYFTLSQSSSYMYMRSTSSSYFLAVNNNSTPIGSSSGNSRRFRLYRVDATTENRDVLHEATIPISTIKPETGESAPITAINRNDLINILVNVSYSEKLGEFKFEVTNWDTGGGDVTFD